MALIDLLMENTHTIIVYTIFFAILAVTLPFFRHVGRIFPKFSEGRNKITARVLIIGAIVGIVMTVVASCHYYLVTKSNFELFAVITFVFPLILAPAAFLPFYLTKPDTSGREGRVVDNRNAAELVIVYAAFGVVASNFHDILWCGEKTNWFTVSSHSKGELQIWVDLVGATADSYDFFGFFMLLHVVFCGTFATLMLWRYARRYGINLFKNPDSRRAFKVAWIGALLWGYGLYLMDKASLYFKEDGTPSIAWIVGTFIWIPLGILILGYSGKYISRFETSFASKASET